jgi:AraC-like DNA-binding protein
MAFDLPENVAVIKATTRCWNGMNVSRAEYTCTGRVIFHNKKNQEATRVGAQLEFVGRERAELRSAPSVPNPNVYKPRPMYMAPAEMELWGHSKDARYLKCGLISFDVSVVKERFEVPGSSEFADTPRLRFSDDRLWTLIKLLTEAIDDSDPTSQLYGDSLTAAVVARILEKPKERKGNDCRLSAIQLNDALNYLEAKMPARVDLLTLANLAGLSLSHYSRAFKASTGLAPYQWQLQARVEKAKDLLVSTNKCLEDIAGTTGFADAAHFGRKFRQITGATPAAWRTGLT